MSTLEKKKGRMDLSLEEKIKVLDRMKELPAKRSKTQTAMEFGISRRTLLRIQESETSLRASFSQGKWRGQKRKRKGKDSEVEEALNAWFSTVGEDVRQSVTGQMLRVKAEELGRQMGKSFRATGGWLSRWKVRAGITLKRAHGEKQSSADVRPASDFERDRPQILVADFDDSYIYKHKLMGSAGHEQHTQGSFCAELTPQNFKETLKTTATGEHTIHPQPQAPGRAAYRSFTEVRQDALSLPQPWFLLSTKDDLVEVGVAEASLIKIRVCFFKDFSTRVFVFGLQVPPSVFPLSIERCRISQYLTDLSAVTLCPGIRQPELQEYADFPPSVGCTNLSSGISDGHGEQHFYRHVINYRVNSDHRVICEECVRSVNCDLILSSGEEMCGGCMFSKVLLVEKMNHATESAAHPLNRYQTSSVDNSDQGTVCDEMEQEEPTVKTEVKTEIDVAEEPMQTLNSEPEFTQSAMLQDANVVCVKQEALEDDVTPTRLTGRHFLRRRQDSRPPECIVCSNCKEHGWKRVQTSYECKTCLAPLCPEPCFELYHTVDDFKGAAARRIYGLGISQIPLHEHYKY